MKTVNTQHCIVIDDKFANYISDTNMHCHDTLAEDYVRKVTKIERMLKYAYILNDTKLCVHGVELMGLTRVPDSVDKYNIQLAWTVDNHVDPKHFADSISDWLAKNIGMWIMNINRVEPV